MGICKSHTISDFTFQSVKLLVWKFRGASLQDFLEKRVRELGWPLNAMVNMMRLDELQNSRHAPSSNLTRRREDAKGNAKSMVVALAKDPDRYPARA